MLKLSGNLNLILHTLVDGKIYRAETVVLFSYTSSININVTGLTICDGFNGHVVRDC